MRATWMMYTVAATAIVVLLTGCDDFDASKELGVAGANALAEGDEEALVEISQEHLADSIASGERDEQFELATEHLDPSMEWDVMSWSSNTSATGEGSRAQAHGILVQAEESGAMWQTIFRYAFSSRDEAAVEVQVVREPDDDEFQLIDFGVLPPE